ncbi:MAG: tol-pal system protein YbgF [Betaproteobacteria bacterium]|nr:MAG: tol-pal system protein YbgF [Betaproteobacteria bacterium]
MNSFLRLLTSCHPSRRGVLTATVFATASLIVLPSALGDSLETTPPSTVTLGTTDAILIAQAEAPRPDARAMVQLMNQLEGLNRELNKLRGKVEELSNSIRNADKRQKDMYLDLDTRLRRLESSNTEILDETKKTTGTLSDLQTRVERLEQSAATGSIPSPVTSASPDDRETNLAVLRAYEAAMAKYRAGEYQDAIAAFQHVAQQYPQHPLAVNAQYWTGDAYYQLRAYRNAIDAQKELIAKYPNSAKAADAMLNMGSAFIGLEDAPAARDTWEKLIATYPDSRAAKNAQERLKRLP